MLRKISQFLRWLEASILVVLFLSLLFVAVAQVLLRNIGSLSIGLSWGDELVSMTVLWITLIGAMIAVREKGHIRVDIMDRFLPPQCLRPAAIVANLCACGVCLAVAFYSVELIVWEFQDKVPGIGVIPSWLLVSIIPFACVVMGIRFALSIFTKKDE